jgi:hypothetical protein
MSAYASWCDLLESTLSACKDGTPLRLEAVRQLGADARSMGSELDEDQRRHVKSCIEELSKLIRAGMRQLDEELAACSNRKQGVRGYGQLRASTTGQRLRRRA